MLWDSLNSFEIRGFEIRTFFQVIWNRVSDRDAPRGGEGEEKREEEEEWEWEGILESPFEISLIDSIMFVSRIIDSTAIPSRCSATRAV